MGKSARYVQTRFEVHSTLQDSTQATQQSRQASPFSYLTEGETLIEVGKAIFTTNGWSRLIALEATAPIAIEELAALSLEVRIICRDSVSIEDEGAAQQEQRKKLDHHFFLVAHSCFRCFLFLCAPFMKQKLDDSF
jgi:hypothetical protein